MPNNTTAQMLYNDLEQEVIKTKTTNAYMLAGAGMAAFLGFLNEHKLAQSVVNQALHKAKENQNYLPSSFLIRLVNDPDFGLQEGLRKGKERRQLATNLAEWIKGKNLENLPASGKKWGEIVNDDDATWGQLALMAENNKENQRYANARKALWGVGDLFISSRILAASQDPAGVIIATLKARGGEPDTRLKGKEKQCECYRPHVTAMAEAFLKT